MKGQLKSVALNFRAMGVDVSAMLIVGVNASTAKTNTALENVQAIFKKNEKIFSRFKKDSELCRLNASVGKEMKVSPEMFSVLKLCLRFNKISKGYFDPRIISNLEKIGYDKDFNSGNFNTDKNRKIKIENIQGILAKDLILNPNNPKSNKRTVLIRKRVDTTGLAKGYTVDEAASWLLKAGFFNFIIDAGGDMSVRGLTKDRKEWPIGIEGLDDRKIMLCLKNKGIATSGISRKKWTVGRKKFHHLVNPKNPRDFSWELKTVTVIEEKTVEADGQAKILFLMGKKDGLKFANRKNIKALFLDYEGNVFLSKKMKENIWKI